MYYTDKLVKPFHSCNAHTEHYKDMEMFVSYTTPIAISGAAMILRSSAGCSVNNIVCSARALLINSATCIFTVIERKKQ